MSLLLLLFPHLVQTLVNTGWPKLSPDPNLSPGAWLRSLQTLTLFELDPGDQMAPNITCYFCTVAVDRTLGLQLSGVLVERLSFFSRAAAVEFGENTVLLTHEMLSSTFWRGTRESDTHENLTLLTIKDGAACLPLCTLTMTGFCILKQIRSALISICTHCFPKHFLLFKITVVYFNYIIS